ncbi:NAD(P)H-hydrate dehydratase [Gelidibacter pelagius]|uniref:Bifunctional NAD(P)H-hydrate repair enzyme n=1 Tax=Gelidibacter pelagius TaxID=2819985 RepID=A0ABS3SQV0_9FLAO|nr:NAD(P)H-hydrate dehydratase [Gelidibacter pelagius]MBO3098085.1 NAD(P)H-hydrate dehydratase [Gelidibacter pelagius]
MKIFSKEQIYEGDQLTAKKQNISSTELMERAGTQIFNWIHQRMQGAQVPIHVFCGIGNNGGDGLVLARQLINYGYNVHTYVVNCSDKRTKDFLVNYDRIKQTTKKWPIMLNCKADFPPIGPDDIIVDAVFGIGLNRPPNEWVKGLFQHFRASKAFTLAIDLPSGLYADKVPEDENGVVWADYTLSFQSPKLVFFLPDTSKYTRQWEVLDIGIDLEFLQQTETEVELIGKNEMLPIYKPREKFSHKGTYGHGLLIGGSHGKIGAMILSGRGALASGAGLITTFIPKCGYIPMQSVVPEIMVITDVDEEKLTAIKFDIEPTAIGIGMGLGLDDKTHMAFQKFLKSNSVPLVIDADGINLLSKHKVDLKLLKPQTVFTPHPKELERLLGKWKNDFDKLKKAKTFSKKYKCILVIKGAHTITVFEDKLYVNSTGNPGLATGGTGDVLTGIITGLIGQGYESLTASLFAVYLHGKSADIAVEDYGYQSLTASHIIDYLGQAYLDLFAKPPVQPQQENGEENP